MHRKVSLRKLMNPRHPLSPISNRVIFTSLVFLASILVASMFIHLEENWTFLNSFYFIAMVTTTNGAPFPATTSAVVLFTSLWAYFSFILLATIITLAFGPLVGYLIKDGGEYIKRAEEELEKDIRK